MLEDCIAERVFATQDQELFVKLSGDRNPMHVDSIVARRTLAGFPVVHGMHTVLWALDLLARYLAVDASVASIKVSFKNFVYVGDQVGLSVKRNGEAIIACSAYVGATVVMTLWVTLGPANAVGALADGLTDVDPSTPIDLSFAQMASQKGRILCLRADDDAAAKLFPDACRILGHRRILALARSSFLVGMVCPGLHSAYRSLQLNTITEHAGCQERLSFAVIETEEQLRLVRLTVAGLGWSGTIDAHARPEPTRQPAMSLVASRVDADVFSGETILVVGGSRGLGELFAKIAAAGGARVIITYSVGKVDAECVRREIISSGGMCDLAHFDVLEDASKQIIAIGKKIDQVFYLATPLIYKKRSIVFDDVRLADLTAFYCRGFFEVYWAVRRTAPDRHLAFFYPSSVFVEQQVSGMAEYAMAKAAGEVLCEYIQATDKHVSILTRRLPKLPTDQTASLIPSIMPDALDCLIEIALEVLNLRKTGRASNLVIA